LRFKIKGVDMRRMIKKKIKMRWVESEKSVDQIEIASMMKSAIEAGLKKMKRNFRSGRSREEISSASTTTSIRVKSLKALRKFYNDEKIRFKSPKQAKAL
jgi:hypothetical protein